MYELGPDGDYDEIWKFAQNILALPQRNMDRQADIQAIYFATAAQVNLAKRLDSALQAIKDRTMDAAQHVGKVTENQTRLMLDAYNRSIEQTNKHADRIEALTRSLTRATWVLAAATIALVFVTAALVFSGT